VRIVIQRWSGSEAGRSDSFPLGNVVIGRDESCDLRLDLHRDLEVSGRHAEIYLDPERGLRLRDLGSTNGTWLDGARIEDAPLRSGARIELGRGGLLLRVRLRRSLRERLAGRDPSRPAPPP
jgi:pSer/pThr/pTyr-binding forkhead associated (FHA) protein